MTQARLILCLVWTLLLVSPEKATGEECVIPAPVAKVGGIQWYADPHGSIVDKDRRAANDRLQEPIRTFLNELGERVDAMIDGATDRGIASCILRTLTVWASARALLSTPTWSVPTAEQTLANVALQFIFLKMKMLSLEVPHSIEEWRLSALRAILNAYAPPRRLGNLYVWSAVAAATGDLLQPNDELRKYHLVAWRIAINEIRADGSIDVEMARGQRALVYHSFFRNAAAILWRLRTALNIETGSQDLVALRRLSVLIGNAACDTTYLARQADSPQEPLDRWNRSLAAAFASPFATEDWSRCAAPTPGFLAPGYGGRLELTSQAIKTLAVKNLRK